MDSVRKETCTLRRDGASALLLRPLRKVRRRLARGGKPVGWWKKANLPGYGADLFRWTFRLIQGTLNLPLASWRARQIP